MPPCRLRPALRVRAVAPPAGPLDGPAAAGPGFRSAEAGEQGRAARVRRWRLGWAPSPGRDPDAYGFEGVRALRCQGRPCLGAS
jgi:hypothetical protein